MDRLVSGARDGMLRLNKRDKPVVLVLGTGWGAQSLIKVCCRVAPHVHAQVFSMGPLKLGRSRAPVGCASCEATIARIARLPACARPPTGHRHRAVRGDLRQPAQPLHLHAHAALVRRR